VFPQLSSTEMDWIVEPSGTRAVNSSPAGSGSATTSPTLRGKWILDNLLGSPPPPPLWRDPSDAHEAQEAFSSSTDGTAGRKSACNARSLAGTGLLIKNP